MNDGKWQKPFKMLQHKSTFKFSKANKFPLPSDFKNIIFSVNASNTLVNRFGNKAASNELFPLTIYIDSIDCIAEVIIYIFPAFA